MNKHVFAFYKHNLSKEIKHFHTGEIFSYKDAKLWSRLVKIVRIKPQDLFILFDHEENVTLQATEEMIESKRIISGIVQKKEINKPILPTITLLLPILKKDAFEYAIYVATQIGVQTIVPVITHKSQTALPAIFDRLQKLMIAACEQSKNFIAPYLEKPVVLTKALETCEKIEVKIWFDEHGSPTKELSEELFKKIKKTDTNKITVIIGPEGGFSQDEEKLIHQANFTPYKLTPTILRSREAICVGLGIVRSFLG